MIYAPIIIPTLNRIGHLKRCIESLKANPWADKTKLIISVDFPPSEKYQEGYKSIKSYLDSNISGFDEVIVINQLYNLGPTGNSLFLIEYIKNMGFDRFIYAEDDVYFAQNAIEYLDRGLDKFEPREDIWAICSSYCIEDANMESNYALIKSFSAWGYGTWISKYEKVEQSLKRTLLLNIWKDKRCINYLSNHDMGLLFSYQDAVLRRGLFCCEGDLLPPIDQSFKLYMLYKNMYSVIPVKNKTWNGGFDGSGVNCAKDEKTMNRVVELDGESSFDFGEGDEREYIPPKKKKSMWDMVRIVGCYIRIFLHYKELHLL